MTTNRTFGLPDAGRQSKYLKYLPSVYSESDFAGRFLMIFEETITPVEQMVDNIASYLDPDLAPEELLPWLASWANIHVVEAWDESRKRSVVRSMFRIFQWQGTRKGLRECLKLYLNIGDRDIDIQETFGGIPMDGSAKIGVNTVIGSSAHNSMIIVLQAEDPGSVDRVLVEKLIEDWKPAHVGYTLEIRPRADASAPEQTAMADE
jgi:phage tail-like protein